MKVREYVIVKDEFAHSTLEEVSSHDWNGDSMYMSEIHQMLNEVFRMNRLSTERAYVVAFDHVTNIKGICQIGQGDINSTPTPSQNVFTFLLLSGAYSFIVVHNHVSNIPEPSKEDKINTAQFQIISNFLDLKFLGHMIINPNGYIIDGGTLGQNGNNEENEADEKGREIEYLENGMAATYVFGDRIEGTVEEIEKIVYDDTSEE